MRVIIQAVWVSVLLRREVNVFVTDTWSDVYMYNHLNLLMICLKMKNIRKTLVKANFDFLIHRLYF